LLKCFLSRDVKIFVKAFNVYVRPLLEYNSPVWSPLLKKDIQLLERVQRKFTKRVCSLCNIYVGLSYDDRLKCLNLDSLERRRNFIDIVEMFKTVKKFSNFNLFCKLTLTQGVTRGHRYKLSHEFVYHRSLCHFLFNRTRNTWNNLPDNIFNTNVIASFKERLLTIM
jgi:hypothetical protein